MVVSQCCVRIGIDLAEGKFLGDGLIVLEGSAFNFHVGVSLDCSVCWFVSWWMVQRGTAGCQSAVWFAA